MATITQAVGEALVEWAAADDGGVREFLSSLADHGYAVVPINYTEGNTNDGTSSQGDH